MKRQTTEKLLLTLAAALERTIERGLMDDGLDVHVQAFMRELRLAQVEAAGRPVRLRMVSSQFVHGDQELTEPSIRGRHWIEALRACGAGGIGFAKEANERDVRELLWFATRVRHRRTDLATAARALLERGVVAATLLDPLDDYEWAPLGEGTAASAMSSAGFELEAAAPIYHSLAQVVTEATAQAARGEAVDMGAARSASERIASLASHRFDDLLQLCNRIDFDVFTVQHSLRVALMATYVGMRTGASAETLTEIGAAALMHDVGKGRIPLEILHKPGRLDEDERRIIQRHPELGTEILLESPDMSPCALGAAFGHHLRFDGKGYPATRPWSESSKITSLIQVADVFEALTARRPYKAPYSPARAYKILFGDDGAFDPAVLAVFTRAMGLYPPGRFVRLSDGRLGRVSVVGRQFDRLTVRVLPDGQAIELGAPQYAALSVLGLVEDADALREAVSLYDAGPRFDEPEGPLPRATDEESLHVVALDDDEELQEDGELTPGLSHGCGHGDDCRLC